MSLNDDLGDGKERVGMNRISMLLFISLLHGHD